MRNLEEVNALYPEKELLEKISKLWWWHSIQLSTKVKTPGVYAQVHWDKIVSAIPSDLTGKSVLDIGAHHGGFSFECERRNAKEIVAIDIWDSHFKQNILLCKEILDSKIQLVNLDVYEIETLDRNFDIILCFGILYALRNPFLILQKLHKMCNELIIVEAEIIRTDRSICYVLEQGEIVPDQPLTILFSPTSLKNYALAIGFKKVDFLGYLTDIKTPVKSDQPSEGDGDQLTRNRGIFYLWK